MYATEATATGNVFDEMGVYWAEIADKSQTERQINFLKSQLKPGGYVLDLACGTGRHMIPLSMAGFSMVGLDASPRLLKIAKQRYITVDVVLGDMRFLPFKTSVFEAAVSMDTSFGYLPSGAGDMQSLADVRRVLKQEGKFIIDIFNRSHLVAKYQGKTPTPKSLEYPSFYLQQKRTVSDNGGSLCDHWTIRDKSGGQTRIFEHTVRLYEQNQLADMLTKAGFVVNRVYGDYERQMFSVEAPRLIMTSTVMDAAGFLG